MHGMAPMIRLDCRQNDPACPLVLTLGGRAIAIRPYFFALDGDGPEGRNIRTSLHALLGAWRLAVTGARAGETLFLPFGFEDQSMSWLRCRITDEDCALQAGWTPQEGARVRPSGWSPAKLPALDLSGCLACQRSAAAADSCCAISTRSVRS